MIRLGMIGLGVIARFYAAALDRVSGVELAAVCDLAPDKLAAFARPGVQEFTDYQTLLDSGQVDAILINAPNDQHLAISAAALRAGTHVCCEKPLTTRFDDAAALFDLAESAQRTLFTAFHRRYNVNLFRRLPELRDRMTIASVSANYLERIQDHAGDDSWYLDPRRCGGGCIADNGPNVFDALHTFLGPLFVTRSRVIREQGIDFKAIVDLRTVEDVPVEVNLDWQYERGEKKTLSIRLRDRRLIEVDFLGGFTDFKGSLWHEYEGVLADFLGHIARGESNRSTDCEAVRLVEDSYAKEVAA